ncbi:hypothetical protein BpHYR1_010832, partial [Brachionus plicatilis]
MITPIPKSKTANNQPSDFRLISVSSCFANVLEHIILQNIDIRTSLDAQKAFDKLWRTGLFFKLKETIHEMFWRVLFNYHNVS